MNALCSCDGPNTIEKSENMHSDVDLTCMGTLKMELNCRSYSQIEYLPTIPFHKLKKQKQTNKTKLGIS
jgi:hypothetical protein